MFQYVGVAPEAPHVEIVSVIQKETHENKWSAEDCDAALELWMLELELRH